MCTVLVACSFQVVTQHLCNKLIQVHVACCGFFFFFVIIMWLSYCTQLIIGPYLLQLLTCGLQCYLLKGPAILWFWVLLVLKMFFQSHLLFSLHTCTCTFFHSSVLRVVGVITVFFFFFYCLCLPFSVQAGLQILTYLCDFLFFFVLWIYFQTALFEGISLSFDA